MNEQVPVSPAMFQPSQVEADRMLDRLLWWTLALRVARAVPPRLS